LCIHPPASLEGRIGVRHSVRSIHDEFDFVVIELVRSRSSIATWPIARQFSGAETKSEAARKPSLPSNVDVQDRAGC